MPDVTLPYLFAPRSYQWAIWDAWDAGIRRFAEVWHRRAGKDKTLLNFIIERMMTRVGNYCHVFPLKNQARRAIWQGIDREGRRYIEHFPPALIYRIDDQEMVITLRSPAHAGAPGSTYQLLGADKDFNIMVGTNPIGIIFSEYSIMNPRAWDLARPILRENGGWAAFVYTPRGKNHGFALYTRAVQDPAWHTSLLTVDHTRRDGAGEDGSQVVSPEGIAQDRAEGMSEADVLQEYYCAFDVPAPGAVYGAQLRAAYEEGRITSLAPVPGYPVQTCWDLGLRDATAIWYFQVVPGADGLPWYQFIDYDEDTFVPLVEWVKRVRSHPYQYASLSEGVEWHYAPHDLSRTEYGTGRTRPSIAQESVTLDDGREVPGLHFRVVPRGPLADGLETVRTLFPRFVFDQDRCERGLDALNSYTYTYDEVRKQWSKEPEHTWASDAADALRTGAVGLAGGRHPTVVAPPTRSFAWARRQAALGHRGGRIGTFRL